MNILLKVLGVVLLVILWVLSDRYIHLLSKRMNNAATSHNRRVNKTQLDLEEYLNGNNYIKNVNWVKQQDAGKIYRKKFKVHDYSNGYHHVITK